MTKTEVVKIYEAELARLTAEKSEDAPLWAWRATRTCVFGLLHDSKPSPKSSDALMQDVLHAPKRETKAKAIARRDAEAVKLAKSGNVEAAQTLLAKPIERPLMLSKELRREHESHTLVQKHHQEDLWTEADAIVASAGITETGRVN